MLEYVYGLRIGVGNTPGVRYKMGRVTKWNLTFSLPDLRVRT
jgi:hypothetical protein